MTLRDEAVALLVAWNGYELDQHAPSVIDYACAPLAPIDRPVPDRLAVYGRLCALHAAAVQSGESALAERLDADLAYCEALLGRMQPLDTYLMRTQGCRGIGWHPDYVDSRRELAIEHLEAIGIGWGHTTAFELDDAEELLDVDDAVDAIRAAAHDLEHALRDTVGTEAPYDLTTVLVDEDVYWTYWLDGTGTNVRLRINRRTAQFTQVRARQFALHEILGHALQYASLAAESAKRETSWLPLFSVHTPHQALFEGLAQALPLFVTPDDAALTRRVRLDHYLQLVRGNMHIDLGKGTPISDIADVARRAVPFWTDNDIADALTDRGTNPLLRSYLWSYPAGIDWFIRLAEDRTAPAGEVLHAAYRDALTPRDLTALWPAGPHFGG